MAIDAKLLTGGAHEVAWMSARVRKLPEGLYQILPDCDGAVDVPDSHVERDVPWWSWGHIARADYIYPVGLKLHPAATEAIDRYLGARHLGMTGRNTLWTQGLSSYYLVPDPPREGDREAREVAQGVLEALPPGIWLGRVAIRALGRGASSQRNVPFDS